MQVSLYEFFFALRFWLLLFVAMTWKKMFLQWNLNTNILGLKIDNPPRKNKKTNQTIYQCKSNISNWNQMGVAPPPLINGLSPTPPFLKLRYKQYCIRVGVFHRENWFIWGSRSGFAKVRWRRGSITNELNLLLFHQK